MSKSIAATIHHLGKITLPTWLAALVLSTGLGLLWTQPVHAQGPVINIGDLPPGKVVTITFRAAITNPVPASVTEVCNQGVIAGDNFATIVTDDPTTPAANDPTCTPLDLPAVSIAAGAIPSETGPTNGSFILSLTDAAPAGGLTVNYSLTGSTAATPADYSLAAGTNLSSLTGSSFTIAAGQSSATVNIVPVDDQVDDDGEIVQINLVAGSGYILGATTVASRTIIDNDTRGVAVSTAGVNVTEGGATAQYTLRLDTIPTATVTITFNPGSQLDPITALTFPADVTALNSQTVTVTATDDTVVEGDHTGLISHSASGGGYDGVNIPNVSASITDNDIAYTLAAGQVDVTEGNTGATPISFSLTRTGDITRSSTVNVAFSGTATNGADYNNVSPAPGTVSFSAGQASRTITLDVLGDFVVEADETITVTLSAATGTNASGTGTISGSPAGTTILDDDSAGIVVTPTNLTISEPNGSASFNIRLTSQPAAMVTISLSLSSAECSLPAASVSLNSLNWDTGVTTIVTAVDDPITDGPQPCDITTGATSSSDPDYDGREVADISVTVNDNDVPGITVTASRDLTTTETGGVATFSVVLNTQPTADVMLTLTSADPTEGTVAPASLSFSPANWNLTRTITVTGVNDDLYDGDQPYTIVTNDPTSGDPNYDGAGANPADVSLTNLDDDTAGFSVSAISGQTGEDGLTATFTVRLTSQPTAPVSLPVTSSDPTEGTASPAALSFTTLDWNIPQTVTVTGVDDTLTDGDVAYTVQTGPATSSDPGYQALNPSDVPVVNLDNEGRRFYLPLIIKEFVGGPDLVIDSLTATSNGVTLVLRNRGNAPVVDAFWVDVYVNPTATPSLNQRWQDIASHGQVWGVTGAGLNQLTPGGTLTLTSGGPYYFPQFSSALPLPVGANVFALADSVDFSTSYGAVQESNEANNLRGPVISTAGSGSPVAGQAESPSLKGLPDRE